MRLVHLCLVAAAAILCLGGRDGAEEVGRFTPAPSTTSGSPSPSPSVRPRDEAEFIVAFRSRWPEGIYIDRDRAVELGDSLCTRTREVGGDVSSVVEQLKEGVGESDPELLDATVYGAYRYLCPEFAETAKSAGY